MLDDITREWLAELDEQVETLRAYADDRSFPVAAADFIHDAATALEKATLTLAAAP